MAKRMKYDNWHISFYKQSFAHKLTYTSTDKADEMVKFMKEALKRSKDIEFSGDLKIYDQCCGNGSFVFAVDNLGLENKIVGVDMAESIIALANSSTNNKNLKFYCADVCKYVEPKAFDICTCWHTSCCYSMDDTINLLQFKKMSECLKPGGLFIIDTINPEFVRANFIQKKAEILDDDTIIARWYTLEENDLSSKWTIYNKNGTNDTFYGHTRIYSVEDLTKMLYSVGLHVIDIVGNYEFDPINNNLGRMILYGVKE